MTMTTCPACDRPAHAEDITDGFCPDCRDNATAHELRAEVRRLRAREATLRESLEVYADPHFWQVQSLVPLGGFTTVNVIPAAQDGGAKAREALAADPSAPATEARP